MRFMDFSHHLPKKYKISQMIRQISFLPVCPLCLIINDEITKYHIYLSLTHQDITTLTKLTKYYDKLFQQFNVLVENVYLKKIMLYLDEESHAIYTFVILTQSVTILQGRIDNHIGHCTGNQVWCLY